MLITKPTASNYIFRQNLCNVVTVALSFNNNKSPCSDICHVQYLLHDRLQLQRIIREFGAYEIFISNLKP